MSWANYTIRFAIIALPLAGCAGPALFRGEHAARESAEATSENWPAEDGAQAAESGDKRLSSAIDSRDRDVRRVSYEDSAPEDLDIALADFRAENPADFAELKRWLDDPGVSPQVRQMVIRQVLAQSSRGPLPPAPVTPAPMTPAPMTPAPVTRAPATPADPLIGAMRQTSIPDLARPAPQPAPVVSGHLPPPLARQDVIQQTPPLLQTMAASTPVETDSVVQGPSSSPAPVELPRQGDSAVARPLEELPNQTEREDDLQPGQWREMFESSLDALEKELARFEHDDSDATRLRAYQRLMHVVLNQRDQAVQEIDGLSEDEKEYWKHQLYGLLVSLDAESMHARSRRAALALRDLRAAADHLSNLSTLDVRGLALCSRVESYGRYSEFTTYSFSQGDELLLYVEVDNFAVEQLDDKYETELQGEYELFDESGVRIANVVLPRDRQLCNNRRRDYFIAYRVYLPTNMAPGVYRLQLTIEDLKGKKSNQSSVEFRVR